MKTIWSKLKLGVQDIPYQGLPNQRMDMTGNDSEHVNLRYKGQYDWGKLEARAYHEDTRHKMNFMEDKQYWYYPDPSKTLPPAARLCRLLPPACRWTPEARNTAWWSRETSTCPARDLLRVGGEYQRYRLDDWWRSFRRRHVAQTPSGTSTMASVTAGGCSVNGKRSETRNG